MDGADQRLRGSIHLQHFVTAASPCIFSVFNHNKLPGVEHSKKMQEAPVKIGWLNPKGSVIC